MRKEYLGDAVYAEADNGVICLTVSNGLKTTATIFLEPEVMAALEDYNKRMKEQANG